MAERDGLRDGLRTGLAGAAAVSAALAAMGKAKHGTTAWTPFNAIAHMVFGDRATGVSGFAPKETLSGLGLNVGSLGVWGGLYEKFAGGVAFPASLATGAAASALIWVFDYKIMPRRLQPGFEKRLGTESVVATYALLALTLGLSPLWKRGGKHR